MAQIIGDKKVGDILIEQGLVNSAQLNYALKKQSMNPGHNLKIGEIFIEKGWIKSIDLIKVVVEFFHIPLAEEKLLEREGLKNYHNFHFEGSEQEAAEKEKMEVFADQVKEKTADEIEAQRIKELLISAKDRNRIPSGSNAMEASVISKAMAFINDEQFTEAESYLKQAMTSYGRTAGLSYALSFCFLEQHLLPQAMMVIDQFKPKAEENPELVELMADILQLSDAHELAVKYYRKLMTESKRQSRWYFKMGYSLDKLKMGQQALALYTHFIKQKDIIAEQSEYATLAITKLKYGR